MNNYFADEKYCNNWILTENKNPPTGCWVLTTREDWQKPIEIMCYQGIKFGRHNIGNGWEDYEFPSWTSGHGDICKPPVAWRFLPIPYNWEYNDNPDKIKKNIGEINNG